MNKANAEFAGATQITVSPDGLLYTCKIRPSCWSNGESVTSFDYAASWQWALRAHLSHPERLYGIKNARAFKENRCTVKELGIRAPDTETLLLELEHPDKDFINKLSQPVFFPMFGALREPRWFNGPYLVSEQTKEGLILERNPYFWDQKRAFFEQIDIRWIEEIETIYELFKNGQIDWIGDPMSILSLAHIQQLSQKGKLKKQSATRRFILYFNTAHPLLSSPSDSPRAQPGDRPLLHLQRNIPRLRAGFSRAAQPTRGTPSL